MVVTQDKVDIWLENGQVLGNDEIVILEPFVEKFPFYAPTQAILAKAYFNTQNVQYEKQLRKASLTAENRLWLYNYIHTPQPIAHGIESIPEVEKIVLKQGEGQILENEQQAEPLHAIEPKLSLDTEDGFDGTQNINNEAILDSDLTVDDKNQVDLSERDLETQIVEPNGLIEEQPPQELTEPIKENLPETIMEHTTEIVAEKIEKNPFVEPIVPNDEDLVEENNDALVAAISNERVENDEIALLSPNSDHIEGVDADIPEANNFLDAVNEREETAEIVEAQVAPLAESEEMGFTDWFDYTGFNQSNHDEAVETDEEVIKNLPTINESNIEKTAEILQKFLANKPKRGEERPSFYNPEKMSELSDLQDNITVSETLAKVYLTQGEPEMAISVYEKLALKFPIKSTYFATLIKDLKEKHRL